ncbi:MAG: peptide ABC transporter substrate-binding protein [Chlamydiales bacterium]
MLSRLFTILLLCFVSCTNNRENNTKVFRLNLATEPPTLDCRKATDATSMNVLLMLFEGLTRFGFDHKPALAGASSVEVSEDQLTYTFRLREQYWTNGERVTAQDYLYAWKESLNPQFPSLFAYKFYLIENASAIKERTKPLESLGVETPDADTLIVHLTHPAPYFLELLALPTFYPIHGKTACAYPDWSAEAGPLYISNGPFQLDRWDHESEIILSKNPRYWDAANVHLDKISLSMIPDMRTELYMFEMGEIDWAGSPLSALPPECVPALMKEKQIHFYQTNGVYYYKINTDIFGLNNAKIRKALALAINRKEIVEHVLQANQTVATAVVPTLPNIHAAQQLFADGDIVLAQTLFAQGLQELGLKEFPRFTLSYNTHTQHQKVAQAVQQQWKEVLGIQIDLESCDWKVYLPKINRQDYHIGRLGWVGEYNDPISYLEPFKYRDNPHIGGNNETGWENLRYCELLIASDKETDVQKRFSYLQEAEAILIDEMPLIPLFFLEYAYLKKPYVQDVYLSPLGMIDLKQARIKK